MSVESKVNRKKILCVDDDEKILRGLRRILSVYNYDIEVASDPSTGLEFALTESPDLIFLDLEMPKIDGYSFLKAFQASSSCEIPIIILSGKNQMLSSYRAGCSSYLPKPSTPKHIRNITRFFLDDLSEKECENLSLEL